MMWPSRIGIVDATLRQNIGNRVAHGLGDAQLDVCEPPGAETFLVMAGHCRLSKSKASAHIARIRRLYCSIR